MSDIKLPQIKISINKRNDNPTPEDQWAQVNPSCLLAYLGIRGFATNAVTSNSNVTVEKMAVPLIGYYDIFKNFYANTQEENFYIIGATTAINKVEIAQKNGNKIISNTPDKIKTYKF